MKSIKNINSPAGRFYFEPLHSSSTSAASYFGSLDNSYAIKLFGAWITEFIGAFNWNE